MEPGWAVLISMVMGALIGGLTNLLAIVMLFRPHQAWKIGKWSLPMTPGLIPKRQAELARQLGYVVEEHLLSPESVSRFIQEALAPGWFRRFIMDRLDRWSDSEKTPAECLASVGWTAPFRKTGPTAGEGPAWAGHLLTLLRQNINAAPGRTLAQWLGEEGVEGIRSHMPALAHWLWAAGNDVLRSGEGRRRVFRFVHDFIHAGLRGGRMWHALAARFVDEERVASWLYRQMMEWMARPETKAQLARWLAEQWEVYAHKPLDELLKGLGEEERPLEKIIGLVAGRCTRDLLNTPFRDLLAPLKDDAFRQQLSAGLEAAEKQLSRLLPALLRRLPVAQVVERQVLAYPLPQLEKLIVETASRELKMITLLGALIGGLVGLVQGWWMVMVVG